MNTNKRLFYKYVSAKTARIILTSKTLRWSAPALFDDPFDVTRELATAIVPSKLQECVIDRLIWLINNNVVLPPQVNLQTRLIVEAARIKGRDDLRKEIINMLHDSKNDLPSQSSALNELRAMWKAMMPTFRILCLSAKNDIESMWNNYADNHKGVVLEFACLKEFEAPWCIAEPVLYEDRPSLLDNAGWGKLLTLNQEEATKYIFHESCYTKTSDWAYQEEWRVVTFKRPYEDGLYSDYKFFAQTLSSIHFGAHISDEDREAIKALFKGDLSHVNAYSYRNEMAMRSR